MRRRLLKLFLDLDGVLANFDRGILALTGKQPAELSSRALWRAAARASDFFAELAFTRDGKRLWEFCRPLYPQRDRARHGRREMYRLRLPATRMGMEWD